MLPTSFKFRVNSYIKAVLSKTRENSRLKTRYLKGITTEQLFIIFHLRDYSKSSLFYSALKNKLKQTRHIFYFIFNFTRSHIITIDIYIYYNDNFLFCFIHHFLTIEKKLKSKTKGERILTWIHMSASPPS